MANCRLIIDSTSTHYRLIIDCFAKATRCQSVLHMLLKINVLPDQRSNEKQLRTLLANYFQPGMLVIRHFIGLVYQVAGHRIKKSIWLAWRMPCVDSLQMFKQSF